MGHSKGVVKYIREGGVGGEAFVNIELRTLFPGVGNDIVTSEAVLTACRIEKNIVPDNGLKMYLRHLLVKKMDDFFFRNHAYSYAHIPRPFGSISLDSHGVEAHLYEWAHGIDGFPWEMPDGFGNRHHIELDEFNQFSGCFNTTGLPVTDDIADAEDGRCCQNIVHEFPSDFLGEGKLGSIWKRIDFGERSFHIQYDRLLAFLYENRTALSKTLRVERYEMMVLTALYLAEGPGRMKERDKGRLETKIEDYRKKTLLHYTSRGMGHADTRPQFNGDRQSLP